MLWLSVLHILGGQWRSQKAAARASALGTGFFCVWVADAVGCLTDTEHKAASTPRSAIATAVLGLLGPSFVSLWQCSSGWPAGCSPQTARRGWHRPSENLPKGSSPEQSWYPAVPCRNSEKSLSAHRRGCSWTEKLQKGKKRRRGWGVAAELRTCLSFSDPRGTSCLLPRRETG